jgi:hypothetical protein
VFKKEFCIYMNSEVLPHSFHPIQKIYQIIAPPIQSTLTSILLFFKQSKLKLYRTVIRPIVTYASETWVLKETIIQKPLVFERKILRRIFGPTKENHIWRVKTNEELNKMIKHKNIINYIKAQRLSWLGQVQKMPDTRTVKKMFNLKPLTQRSQGRLKYRWEDNIKQDICLMIKNWIVCVQDRRKWKEVVEKAKTFN